MKKNLLLLWMVLTIVPGYLKAQNFDQYFVDKTLRISYSHIGNAKSENIRIDHYTVGEHWYGTRSALVEPHHYGDILLEVFDSVTNTLIFSKSYSCLFTEYRTTERGQTETASMQECVNMPLPKHTVLIKFTSFNRKREAFPVSHLWLDPNKELMLPMVKQYNVMNLHIGRSPKEALDILFVPDGYAKSDSAKLQYDMKRFASYIMHCAPYKQMKKDVNIRAIEGYSAESGITQPQNDIYKNTLLNCRYNVIDLDRYLMCPDVWNLHDVADDAPYDIIIIICNSDKYGGGGIYNFYCTVYNSGEYPDYVIVHEMGHLLGGLADEYYTSSVTVQDFYPTDIEPTEPNLTTLVDFDSKWKDMVTKKTPIPTEAIADKRQAKKIVGAFEGGGYVSKGVYRPCMHCTMKDKTYDGFCPVCLKALKEAILYYSK